MSKVKRVILGITGGIASGKTTVIKLLADHGIPTISSDTLAHQALQRGQLPYRRVAKRYGKKILRSYGGICRRDLAEIVFKNPKERRWLEKQVHPFVIKGLKRFIERHRKGVVALDIPLLFEARLSHLVDKTVVVYATPTQQLRRLCRRTGLSRAQALSRIRSQMPISQKRRRADFVIHNTGTLSSLKRKVAAFVRAV